MNEEIVSLVHSLNKRILRKIEIELEVLEEQGVNTKPILQRLRTGVLDEIGFCKREIERKLNG